jgi:ankyrin repeat protein
MLDIKRLCFPLDIILVRIRWYATYPLSYRYLKKMMQERGARAGLLWLLLGVLPTSAGALSVPESPDIHKTALHKAAEACDAVKVRAILDGLPPAVRLKSLNQFDRDGYTPLTYAAQSGCIPIVKFLVKTGAIVDAKKERWGWTPMLNAAEQRHADVVRYLLAHGADANAKAVNGQTALTAAIAGSLFVSPYAKSWTGR